jgi:hypothetical protein
MLGAVIPLTSTRSTCGVKEAGTNLRVLAALEVALWCGVHLLFNDVNLNHWLWLHSYWLLHSAHRLHHAHRLHSAHRLHAHGLDLSWKYSGLLHVVHLGSNRLLHRVAHGLLQHRLVVHGLVPVDLHVYVNLVVCLHILT